MAEPKRRVDPPPEGALGSVEPQGRECDRACARFEAEAAFLLDAAGAAGDVDFAAGDGQADRASLHLRLLQL